MNKSAYPAPPDVAPTTAVVTLRSLRPFALAGLALLAAFSLPLLALARFALAGGLHSHIVLIPFVSLYFVWLRREELPAPAAADRWVAAGFALAAAALLAWFYAASASGAGWALNDRLSVLTAAFVLGVVAVAAWGLGRPLLRELAFPLAFLVFMIPLPTAVINLTEMLLQHGSATVAYGMLRSLGTPVFRDGLVFMLPGFSMEVAPQCSGINSSYALLITSVAAGYLFLRSPWKRAVLVLAVIPLALLRNGLRVTVIGELCVRVGPEMINSWVHKQGGPFFFALSLIPFSLILLLLYRSDHRQKPSSAS